LKVSKKYKYLDYIPAPIKIDPSLYDLVNDEAFCKPDGRIPLLMAIQYGIFPRIGLYGNKKGLDYSRLEGLENQLIGFIGRGYISNREREGIFKLFLDTDTVRRIRNNEICIDLRLWYNEKGLRQAGPKKIWN
tara:strand:+ start:1269 stop:1667 length:399 start_codon:yes stop_codon:yes gene_type:complete